MSTARFKDYTFDLSGEKGKCRSWDCAQLAALYDIRDELKSINMSLGCYKIQRMFKTLERLDKRLGKKIKLK